MKVEYLVLIDSGEQYCKSINTLSCLIQSYDGIEIKDNRINFKNCTFGYDVQLGDPESIEHRFFHIKISCSESTDLESYHDFLKLLRTILSKISGNPVEILNDEISSNRCIEAYPVIHNIENKMRKLITKFMLTNIGLGWAKEKTPKEVVESIKSSKSRTSNFLYEVDFIQLSKFLFNNYASLDSKKVVEKIKGAELIGDLDLAELREFVPQSNWERYFATIVDCTSDFLEKRWQKLYDIRNKVAHNRFISDAELTELHKISNEVNEKLESAIDNLDKIHISEEQKEEVAENVAFNRDEAYADFLEAWNILMETMRRVCFITLPKEAHPKNNGNWRNLANQLIEHEVLPKSFKSELQELALFRNTLVHHTDVIFTKESISERISLLLDLYDSLKLIEDTEIIEKGIEEAEEHSE